MLDAEAVFPFSPSASRASLQTSNFQVRNLSTGVEMSLQKQSDVKNHLSRRTRSEIHLIQPTSQPDATGFAGVEELETPASPTVTPAENALEQVPEEFEALRNFLVSESSDVARSAASKNVQE
jgi:hypothetical protein